MPVHDDLGNRMKGYEQVAKTSLVKRIPMAIRVDGKAFHTFTRGFLKPFDRQLISAMQGTMEFMCKNIQGCVLGYTQSDEITFILCDYQTLETSAWFDNEVQKICSVAASLATLGFQKHFAKAVKEAKLDYVISDRYEGPYIVTLEKALERGALFDARCFNIPREEVTNLLYWRQLDAIRNSIQMCGQARYSHKELQGMSCEQIKEKLREDKNVQSWEEYPLDCQRGSCCVKTENGGWEIDRCIPIFKGDGRQYIESLITFGE